MKPCRTAKNEPAKPPNMAPIGEGGELGACRVDAERAAGDLVFAQRLPGAPDRSRIKAERHDVRDERETRIR
jgi:hypothetical protein